MGLGVSRQPSTTGRNCTGCPLEPLPNRSGTTEGPHPPERVRPLLSVPWAVQCPFHDPWSCPRTVPDGWDGTLRRLTVFLADLFDLHSDTVAPLPRQRRMQRNHRPQKLQLPFRAHRDHERDSPSWQHAHTPARPRPTSSRTRATTRRMTPTTTHTQPIVARMPVVRTSNSRPMTIRTMAGTSITSPFVDFECFHTT